MEWLSEWFAEWLSVTQPIPDGHKIQILLTQSIPIGHTIPILLTQTIPPQIWVPTWPQLGAKIHDKSLRELSEIDPEWWLLIDPSVFDLCFYDFRPPNQPKINKTTIKRSTQQHNNQNCKKYFERKTLYVFCYFGHVMLR